MAIMKTIASIVKEAEEAKTDKEAAKILKNNSSAALKAVIGYALDPLVHWLIPPGTPPFRPLQKAADQESALYNQYRMMLYFVNSKEGKNLTQIKREQIFIQFLEAIDPDDANLIIRVKDKKLEISPKAAKIAFPNMTKDW